MNSEYFCPRVVQKHHQFSVPLTPKRPDDPRPLRHCWDELVAGQPPCSWSSPQMSPVFLFSFWPRITNPRSAASLVSFLSLQLHCPAVPRGPRSPGTRPAVDPSFFFASVHSILGLPRPAGENYCTDRCRHMYSCRPRSDLKPADIPALLPSAALSYLAEHPVHVLSTKLVFLPCPLSPASPASLLREILPLP